MEIIDINEMKELFNSICPKCGCRVDPQIFEEEKYFDDPIFAIKGYMDRTSTLMILGECTECGTNYYRK